MDEVTRGRIDVALQLWIDVRAKQKRRSEAGGNSQQGNRSAVTAGLHLEGLNQLVVDEISRAGGTDLTTKTNQGATLAGYYRATKSWDLLVMKKNLPVLAVEYKSINGSEGKNLNNRFDEVFGVAEDAKQAEAHGILPRNLRRAYIFVIPITKATTKRVTPRKSYGTPDEVFKKATYLQRTAIMCNRLRDTGLYHLTWAIAVHEDPFGWEEPDVEVGWERFAHDLREAFKFDTPTTPRTP